MLASGYGVRSFVFIFAAIVLACVVIGPLSRVRADDPAAPKVSAAVAKLRQERIATLREASEMSAAMFRQGLASEADVGGCQRALLEAQLEYASTATERVQILREALEAAKKQEAMALNQARAGLSNGLAPLEAKAYRLRVEIQVAEEGGK